MKRLIFLALLVCGCSSDPSGQTTYPKRTHGATIEPVYSDGHHIGDVDTFEYAGKRYTLFDGGIHRGIVKLGEYPIEAEAKKP
jgi:hypothetical protein